MIISRVTIYQRCILYYSWQLYHRLFSILL